MYEDYNNVPDWKYTTAPNFFGADEKQTYRIIAEKVETWADLESTLLKLQGSNGLAVVEVDVDPFDIPVKARRGLAHASSALQ